MLAGGAWSSGPRLRPALFTHRGPVRLLGAQLMPGVARLLAGIDLGAMAVELRALDRLPAQLARLDEWLCGALAGRQVEPRVARALAQLMAAGGAVSMEALGRAVGASPRNLQRLFRDWVGLGPKQVGRILRFQAVLACVERRDALDWAAVAHELGYADQSHLIRDAAAFAGLTPSALLSRSS
jgi:AraC-like DNA-binding protein